MSPKKSTSKVTQPETPASLPPSALRRLCDPGGFSFATTDDLPDLQNVIGQPRAIRALELGSEVSGPGYNTFVLGLPGSGRTTLSREYLARKAALQPQPDDWCYVNNFENPHQPKAIHLPAGRAVEFHKDLQELVVRCQRDVTRLFESDEYTQERDRIVNELKKNQEAEFLRLQEHVEKFSFVIVRTPFGFVLAPAVEGKPLKPEELEKLSPERRAKLSQLQTKLSDEVEKSLNRLREVENNASRQLSELNERTVMFLLSPLMKTLKSNYDGLESVLVHLDAVQADILENADQFRRNESGSTPNVGGQQAQREWVHRYEVNVLVDNSGLKGGPVILESHPSYTNLLGRIEHEMTMGASHTDFSMIRAGALHRANGGYLVIPARDILINPYAWEGLKRVLRDGEIRIVELGQQLGLLSTVTLDPEPIPLNVKVVLVGTPILYYLLRAYDEDFAKLFKVRAEFASTMERTQETEHEYSLFVKSVLDDNHLPPFDRTAIARIIEHSARMADDQGKLSTRFGKIADLIREAAYWAAQMDKDAKQRISDKKKKSKRKVALGQAGDQQSAISNQQLVVTSEAVKRAIEESIYRSNLVEERIQELFSDGTLMIDLSGQVVGQVNSLSVYLLGDYAFGKPSRVTAVAYAGKGGVVDIERQAKLGGPVHTKGILILGGLLGARYGRKQPLSLTASLTFEQSYDEVEGDSASAAELFALLSAISNIPLRQDRAMTGSVNQRGQIQAIGGVNEKIEGFYLTCKTKGLTGEQGVIIPLSNVTGLMLRDEVVQAVEAGQFHIWPVHTVDEGIRLLTDVEAGERGAEGVYPEGSFNRAVMDRLAEFAKATEPQKDSNTKGEATKKPSGNAS
jgi:lon-related putative ATP-dependent protease